MKQYKIIKPYQLTTNDEKILELPIGIILEVDKVFYPLYTYGGGTPLPYNTHLGIPPKILENNPEYFEEIKEKSNITPPGEIPNINNSKFYILVKSYRQSIESLNERLTEAKAESDARYAQTLRREEELDQCKSENERLKKEMVSTLSDSERKIIETIRTALEGGVQKIDKIIFTPHGIVVTG